MGRLRQWVAGSGAAAPRGAGRAARYVVVGTEGRRRFFVPGPLARLVFGAVRDRRDTLAACLMPDHLLWLLRDSREAARRVRELKTLTTRLARHEGVSGRLWERGDRQRVVRSPLDQHRLAARVAEHPVDSGLVTLADDWPYRRVAWERLADEGRSAGGRA